MSKNIILAVTGSIASYKAADITAIFKKSGFNVTILMTREAGRFITPLTLQTLSGNEVIDDMFAEPKMWDPIHVSLAEKADLILIAPATANIIGKIACGIADDILTCVVMAARAPVLIAPAMNDNMYKNRIVQDNILKLKKLGYKFIGPDKGRLASGKVGLGRLADTKDILIAAKRLL